MCESNFINMGDMCRTCALCNVNVLYMAIGWPWNSSVSDPYSVESGSSQNLNPDPEDPESGS